MSILVSGIRTSLDEPQEAAVKRALKRIGVPASTAVSAAISKTSVDARREKITFVHSVLIDLEQGEEAVVRRCASPQVVLRKEQPLELTKGSETAEAPIVVVGFGPAGMFAALLLSEQGYRVTVLERGEPVEQRTKTVEHFWKTGTLAPESNVQFGEGGAGTFSDGKLTTRIGDSRCGYVLSRFVEFGAPEEIRFRAKPHVGTDHLKTVVHNIRRRIQQNGGEVRFSTCFEGVRYRDGRVCSVIASGQELPASAVILAVGHSARDTFETLYRDGYLFSPKPFSVGVRVEHLQSEVDRALYHELAGHPSLPKGEYQLSYRKGEEAVYTFCMCPGGFVVPSSSEAGGVVVNGMSEYARDQKNANAALVVSVDPRKMGSSPLEGIAFQRNLEQAAFRMGGGNYSAPVQTAGRFLNGQAGYDFGRVLPSYQAGIAPGDFAKLFPDYVTGLLKEGLVRFGRKQNGFDAPDTVLTGVETRTSSPVRIERDETFQALSHPGVYPCGEGAGYAGGIMSAAVDGIRVAQAVMKRFAPHL